MWFVTTQTESYSIAHDLAPVAEVVDYYEIIKEIIELDYFGYMKGMLFKCDQYDVNSRNSGIKFDEYGFTHINRTHIYHLMNHMY